MLVPPPGGHHPEDCRSREVPCRANTDTGVGHAALDLASGLGWGLQASRLPTRQGPIANPSRAAISLCLPCCAWCTCRYSNFNTLTIGAPTGVRQESGAFYENNEIIRNCLRDGQHVWVALKERYD